MIGNDKQHLSSKESTTMGPRANHRHFPQPPSCHCGCRSHLQVPAPPVDVDQDPATCFTSSPKDQNRLCVPHGITSVVLHWWFMSHICIICSVSFDPYLSKSGSQPAGAGAPSRQHPAHVTHVFHLDGLIWNRKTDQDMPLMIINHGIHGANR